MPTVNGHYGLNMGLARMKAKAAEQEESKAGEIRELRISPAGDGRFSVECEYANGQSDERKEIDAQGVAAWVAEKLGAGSRPEHPLAGLIPEDATKGKLSVKFKREGAEEDE
jgi:hypothetical protein